MYNVIKQVLNIIIMSLKNFDMFDLLRNINNNVYMRGAPQRAAVHTCVYTHVYTNICTYVWQNLNDLSCSDIINYIPADFLFSRVSQFKMRVRVKTYIKIYNLKSRVVALRSNPFTSNICIKIYIYIVFGTPWKAAF